MAGEKLVIGEVRLSYVYAWEPSAMNGSTDMKYSVVLLIPKTNTALVEKIKASIKAAIEEGDEKNVWKGARPSPMPVPLRDGDTEKSDHPEYAGCYFIKAKSSTQPGIVDIHRNPITNKADLYSGCYGYVSVKFFPYNNVNKGIGALLNNIMKSRDGEAFGGRESPDQDFKDVQVADPEPSVDNDWDL